MGITPAALKILNDMAQKNLFDNHPLRIIELGSQEIHSNESVLIDNLYETFGVSGARRQHIAFGEKGRTLFENLGFIYECINLDGLEQTRAWDINTVQCPEPFREQYVLTTNHGTTEHLIAQDNAFRLLHDLTAVGGFMMHTVSCTGQVNHGFFSYSPIFSFRWHGPIRIQSVIFISLISTISISISMRTCRPSATLLPCYRKQSPNHIKARCKYGTGLTCGM